MLLTTNDIFKYQHLDHSKRYTLMEELISLYEQNIHFNENSVSKIKTIVGEMSSWNLDGLHPVTEKEIEILVQAGNHAESWDLVFISGKCELDQIRNNDFQGFVFLGEFSKQRYFNSEFLVCRESIQDSTIKNSLIFPSSIEAGSILDQCVVEERAVIHNSVIYKGDYSDPWGWKGIRCRNESGEPTLTKSPFLTPSLSLSLADYTDQESKSSYNAFLQKEKDSTCQKLSIISFGCFIDTSRNCKQIYLGPGTKVKQCTELHNSSILSLPAKPTNIIGALSVSDSVIHPGVKIETGAIVKNSMLFEANIVDQQGICIDSVIFPNNHISRGEVNNSFLGPFVGSHHQSLLISAFWPGGKGNIGYGANIGSNHSSRKPDQEIIIGDGVFFGLSSIIKFPLNLKNAHYSIIATGTTLQAQRIQLPFSLIVSNSSFTRLIPAWVISENWYSLMRNEEKYQARNNAKLYAIDTDVFSPPVIESLEQALGSLEKVQQLLKDKLQNNPPDVITKKELPELGETVMKTSDLEKGITAYSYCINFVKGRTLLKHHMPGNPRFSGTDTEGKATIEAYEKALRYFDKAISKGINKDWDRGKALLPDYSQTHDPPEADSLVMKYHLWTKEELQKLDKLI